MNRVFFAVLTALGLAVAASEARADDFVLDPMHTSVVFKISHLELSWTFGRFNDVQGEFVLAPADPSRNSFALVLKTESVDTNNAARDKHLRSLDFFNAKQFPLIAFKSKSVKAVNGGYEAIGDFSMHGVTKEVKLDLRGGRMVEFPKGVQRTGFTVDLLLHRSDYGMTTMVGPIGEDVHIAVSFEGTKK